MDIEGERKSRRREEKETAGGIEPGRRYIGKNEGKGEVVSPYRWGEKKEGR